MASIDEKIEALRNDTSVILDEMKPVIDSAARYTWNLSMGHLPLTRRAILCRQHECLQCISMLVESGRGYAGVPLLRPACEELVWAKYLATIDKDSANDLLLCLLQKEIHDSLIAQDNYLGRTATKEAGLLDPLERLTHHLPKIRRKLGILGTKLRWPKKSIEKGTVPSIGWLAKETGNAKIYNFLYHAASRYVHFSMAELLRRAWGTPEELTIRSANFGDYWSSFALAWGLRLLSETYLIMHESLEADGVIDPDVGEGSKILDAYKRIADFGLIPIITRAELSWNE